MARIDIDRDVLGQWRFTVKSSNDLVIATSMGYASKRSCKRGAETLKKIMNLHDLEMFDIVTHRREWL